MLRWWPLFWVLSMPAVPLKPDPAQISTAEPPRRFDQSLEQLERSRVITPLERQGLEAVQPQAPIDVSRYQKACREGALSRQECASGVAVRSLPRSRSAPTHIHGRSHRPSPQQATPSSVPVSALLAGAQPASAWIHSLRSRHDQPLIRETEIRGCCFPSSVRRSKAVASAGGSIRSLAIG